MLLLIVIGLIFVAYHYGKSIRKCPDPIVTHKYIPRDFNIDQEYPDNISLTFQDMFTKGQPGIIPIGNTNMRSIVQ